MQIQERIQSIFKKRALHQTAFVTVGSLINGVSLLVLNIILARALSQEFFGIFSLSVLALSTMAEISDFGLNMGLLRFAPYYIATNQTDKLKQLLKTVWRWRVALTWILTLGGIVLSYPLAKYLFGQAKIAPYLAYSFLGIGGVILLGFLATYLQSNQRFFYQASVQSLKGFLRLLIVIILALAGVRNLFVYLSVYIFVPWILFLVNYGVFPDKFRKVEVDQEVKSNLHSQLAKFSFWLTISSLMAIAGGKIDQVMISHYLGLEQVAVFTVAWQLIQIFPVVYGSISSVLMPKISALVNKTELIAFVKRVFKWVLVGTIGIALLIYPSQYLINFLFGQKYVAAMPVYLILAYGFLLNILAIPFSMTVTIFNKTHIMAIGAFFQLVLLVICNLVFIPRYGIMGVAYTYIISLVANFLWNLIWAFFLIKKKDFIVV
ncbi:MAG: Polysaccharide biosynthesis protein CapF [Parcubacteria group bacterium Gr01-1014_13]|nr:MAG: Polysaccharide biosynthesis protein CapF [Parcubacteria group bacterium Gr01-1014_13]